MIPTRRAVWQLLAGDGADRAVYFPGRRIAAERHAVRDGVLAGADRSLQSIGAMGLAVGINARPVSAQARLVPSPLGRIAAASAS